MRRLNRGGSCPETKSEAGEERASAVTGTTTVTGVSHLINLKLSYKKRTKDENMNSSSNFALETCQLRQATDQLSMMRPEF